MADIPGHHLGHAVLHGVALRGHHQVSAHGGDLLHSGVLARLAQQSHLESAGWGWEVRAGYEQQKLSSARTAAR